MSWALKNEQSGKMNKCQTKSGEVQRMKRRGHLVKAGMRDVDIIFRKNYMGRIRDG